MKTTDLFKNNRSAKRLNESLAKTFGKSINFESFDTEKLEDARNKLRTQIYTARSTSGFNETIENDTLTKAQWMHDAIVAELMDREEHIVGNSEDDDGDFGYDEDSVGEDHGPENPDAAVNYGEYDREGDMAKDDLRTMNSAAKELYSILDADENLPEWVQKKITLAVDYLDTARDYMKANKTNQIEAVGDKSMSRAAKGYEKYGKKGMMALAKAGRDGASEKKLDVIRDEHDRYDEAVAGPKKCWPGHRKTGTQPGTGKNAGKRVNDCEKIKEDVAKDGPTHGGVAEGLVQDELKTINGKLKGALKDYKTNTQMHPNAYIQNVKKLKDRREELIAQLKQGVAEGGQVKEALAQVDEGLTDFARAANYNRLAGRSHKKVIAAMDKHIDHLSNHDGTETDFMKQSKIKDEREAKALALRKLPPKKHTIASVFGKEVADRVEGFETEPVKLNPGDQVTYKGKSAEVLSVSGKGVTLRVAGTTGPVSASAASVTESYNKTTGEYMSNLTEGEIQQASAIVTAKTMVDRVSRWIEELSGMENDTLLQLGDSIRDEMGQEQAKQFISSVAPAIQQALELLKSTREALSTSVRALTGEEQATDMLGAEPGMDMEAPAEPDTMNPDDMGMDDEGAPDDEFSASDAGAGGLETAGRAQRESIDRGNSLLRVLAG